MPAALSHAALIARWPLSAADSGRAMERPPASTDAASPDVAKWFNETARWQATGWDIPDANSPLSCARCDTNGPLHHALHRSDFHVRFLIYRNNPLSWHAGKWSAANYASPASTEHPIIYAYATYRPV